MNARESSDTRESLRVDFKQNFLDVQDALRLGSKLSAFERSLLFRTAFRAALCNISFNGLGGCDGKIKPEREEHRRNLEIEFVAARNCLYASEGWAALDDYDKAEIKRRLLTVRVTESNCAQQSRP